MPCLVQKGNTFCDCDDGVSAGIWVIHTGDKSGWKRVTLFFTVTVMMESVYSSPFLINEYLWYKLWRPSQRVVTLFPPSLPFPI